MRIYVIAGALVVAACTPANTATTPASPILRSYSTTTPSALPATPFGLVVTAQTPLPTPTPSQYTIRQGDTLSQIAERYRLTLDALLAANPQVNPNALRVGEVLQVPASPVDFSGEGTPTPAPLRVQEVACHPTANGAVWCFVTVTNDTPDLVENVTAQVTLLDAAGAVVESNAAVLPLDVLPAGATLPVSVFFPPPLPLDIRPQAQMLTAIRLLPDDQRYLTVETRNTVTLISWSGRSAQAKGEILVPARSPGMSSVWLVAVAYDRSGAVVGWRRWESTSSVPPGTSLPFELAVSSLAGPIERVEFVVQARP